ncbi:hypothetical protein [Celeribacter sp. SCSIO 80788]|uniref:hypothetical protein n=1 Tax=Celeribacter sp. SCSIO 80788 TaxID=3117013 RepID=UPI003DA6A3D7
MTDFYLKFSDRAAALAALPILTVQDDADETVWRQDLSSVVEVGTIYAETGVTLTAADGIEYPETVALDGWHMNVRTAVAEVISAIEALPEEARPEPATPAVVWAGGA